MKNILVYLIIGISINYGLGAAPVNSGVPILNRNSFGARQISLGDTFTGIADDINTLSVNPAGIGFFSGKRISLMYMRYTEDFVFGYAAAGVPINKGFSSVGIEFGYFSMNEFDSYNSVGENSGNSITAGDIMLGISYGDKILRYFNIDKDLSAGATVKFIKSEIAEDKINTFGADVGLLYKTTIFSFWKKRVNNFSAGISVQNIGIVYMPIKYRIGFGYNIYNDKNNSILLGADVIFYNSDNVESSIGIEYTLLKIVSIRAGYKPLGIDTGKLTTGIGVSYNVSGYVLLANYGNILMSDLGNIHTFSISVEL